MSNKRLCIALAIIAIIPIWSVRYLPTLDGPSHLYNSWLLRELVTHSNNTVAEWFQIDWRPHPNWSGHALLALLLFVAPALIAEKIFVSAIVLLFLFALSMYSREPWVALLAMPFAYNLTMQLGFWNFCIGVALYFITVAVWWRRRDRPDARTIVLVAALLVALYFSHPLPLVLAIGSIGLLWSTTKRHALHLLAFVPVAPLLIWFIAGHGTYSEPGTRTVRQMIEYIAHSTVLFTFDDYQMKLGTLLAIVLATLIVITIIRHARRWEERDAFALLMVAIIVIFAVSPSATAGGTVIQERMAIFVALVPLAWVAPRFGKRTTAAIVILLTIVDVAYSGYLVRRYRTLSRRVEELVESAAPIARGSVVLPIIAQSAPANAPFLPIFGHAIDYALVEKQAIDAGNYEASAGYFPIKRNPSIPLLDVHAIEEAPDSVDLGNYQLMISDVFTWSLSDSSPLAPQLARSFTRAGDRGAGRVYRLLRTQFHDPARILLPFAGTTHDRGAADGAIWCVEQEMRNAGPTPVHVVLSDCETSPCSFDLAPGAHQPIAVDRYFIFVYAERRDADQLQFSTTLRRVDDAGKNVRIEIPAVRERDYRSTLVIRDVPLAAPSRTTLRVWCRGEVVVRSGSRVVREIADGRGTVTIVDLAAALRVTDPRATIEVDAGGAPLWGFISITDPRTPAPQILYPR